MKFVRLFKGHDVDKLYIDFVKGLSLPKKKIPFWSTYFGDGYDYWHKICQEYYGKHKEVEMVIEQKQNMLDLFSKGTDKFNMIDMGAGDGDKSILLVEEAIKQKMNTEYIGTDFQHDTVIELSQKMKKFEHKIPMTFMTCKFEQGIEWIQKEKSERNIYMLLGGTFGSLEYHERDELMASLSKNLKKGDIMAFSLNQAIDPYIVQNAFFNERRYWIDWMMESMKRANIQLGANFKLEKFWPHTYYEPASRNVYGVIVSRQNQKVQFRDKEFHFSEGQVIEVLTAQRFTEDDGFKYMNMHGGFHKVAKFQDKKGYTMFLCLQKE